jgi:hypothetical protein
LTDGGADNYSYRHVHKAAAHRECLELFEHVRSSPCGCYCAVGMIMESEAAPYLSCSGGGFIASEGPALVLTSLSRRLFHAARIG